MPSPLFDRLRRLDTAQPPALPKPLDDASEWWAARGARARRALSTFVLLLAVMVVGAVGRQTPATTVSVWVASTSIEVGASVAEAVAPAQRAASDLPDGALRSTDRPQGLATIPMIRGQVLTARHLAPDLTSMVDAGMAVIAVRSDQLAPVPIGAVVDVLAAGIDGTGQRLATRVTVLAGEDGWLWLGVPEATAPAIAAADTAGRLSLARRPVQTSTAPPLPQPTASP